MKLNLSLLPVLLLAGSTLLCAANVSAQTPTPAPAPASAKPLPTADRHKANGIDCESCHGTGKKEPATSEACLACHQSFEEVAKRTKALTPNPHSNHFIKENDVECTSCHHGHKADAVACAQCHRGMTFDPPAQAKH